MIPFPGISGGVGSDHNHTAPGDGGILTNDRHDGYIQLDVVAAPSAGTDMVRVSGSDFAAGDCRALFVSETGGNVWIGNSQIRGAAGTFSVESAGPLTLGTTTQNALTAGRAGATTTINGSTIDVTGATQITLLVTNTFITLTGTDINLVSDTGTVRGIQRSDSASVQVLRLDGDRATPADGDEAYVSMLLSDDGGIQNEIGRLTWVATDVNAATNVDGRIDLDVIVAGLLVNRLQLDGDALSLISGASAIELRLYEPIGGGSSHVGFKAPALAGNTMYTLPDAFPTADGFALKSTIAGVMGWSAGGSDANAIFRAERFY
jgi:hypothetical protein